MGFELGPKLLRRPPKGWLPARAFPIRHSAYDPTHAEHGESEIDTSYVLDALWRVEIEGQPPYELEERRTGPMWVRAGSLGGYGNRWYKVRLKSHYGLMKDVGVPGFVDPGDPSKLWIDWDAAYDEHVVAWEREARVRRAVSERTEHKIESTLGRLGNPFAGKLQPGEEQIVEERVAEHRAREAEQREKWAEISRQRSDLGHTPAAPGESEELMRRIEDLRRIHEVGRKTKATVVTCVDTGRMFANVPVFEITFDLEGRRILFEHVYGPRLIKKYKPGAKVDVWVDPQNPDAIVPN